LNALVARLAVRTFRVAVSTIVFIAAGRVADAATIRVPADVPTIQNAIDVAAPGETVLVAPGAYVEQIDFRGKAITVTSEQGPETTSINANGAGPVVTFQSGESRATVLSGFTLTGGYSLYGGAGVLVSGSSPTIRGNIITGNAGCTGVGVYSYFSSPRIENNTISDNFVSGCSGAWGIGIYIGGDSNAEVIGNRITGNSGADATGAGVALFAAGRPALIGNVIDRNSTRANGGCGWGGGLAIANFAEAKIVNNVIVQNVACTAGAIYWIGTGSGNGSTLVNNTIADNVALSYPGVYLNGVGAANRFFNNVISSANGAALFCQATSWATGPSLDSNDVFNESDSGYGGSCTDQTGIHGNISANANFSDPVSGDYSTGFSSPVVDAGDNAAPYLPATDVAGNPRIASASGVPDRIDIGAYEFFNQGPVADAGDDQIVTAGPGCLATVTLNGSGSDPEGDPLTFVWSGPFGSASGATVTVSLPSGTHVISLTVSDGNGGDSIDTVSITVRDLTAPIIHSVAASPAVITKTNHDMVPVAIAVSSSDGCGAAVTCRIVAVASNEPVSGTGGGDVSPDWQITGDLTLLLRAERSPKGSGRVYTITVVCTDASGNTSTSTTTVTVPRKL
jgi:parallel beta-helix repeat protein